MSHAANDLHAEQQREGMEECAPELLEALKGWIECYEKLEQNSHKRGFEMAYISTKYLVSKAEDVSHGE